MRSHLAGVLQVLHLSHVKPRCLKTRDNGDSKKSRDKQPHCIPLRAFDDSAEARKSIHDLAAIVNSRYASMPAQAAPQAARGAASGSGGVSTSAHAGVASNGASTSARTGAATNGTAVQNGASTAPSPSAPPLPAHPVQRRSQPGVLLLLLLRRLFVS